MTRSLIPYAGKELHQKGGTYESVLSAVEQGQKQSLTLSEIAWRENIDPLMIELVALNLLAREPQ